MNPRDGETCYQHGETSQQEDGATDSETSPGNDESMTVEYHYDQPDCQQSHSWYLRHLKCPGYVRDIVQNDIWQWRVFVHIRDSVMDNCHGDSCQPGHEETVDDCDRQLPPLWAGVAGNVWLGAPGSTGTLEATRGTGGGASQSLGRV